MTGRPAALATLPTSRTLGEKSGPTIRSAPAPIAAWAAWAAPSGVEWSSSTIKVTSLAPDSSTASCAALRSETPTGLGLLPWVSGRITPMRTGPVPRVSPTAAEPFKGWDCTGVVGEAIELSKLGSPLGAAARQGDRRATGKNERGRLGDKTPESGQRGKSRHSDPQISHARDISR